jgi:hypothetical protein
VAITKVGRYFDTLDSPSGSQGNTQTDVETEITDVELDVTNHNNNSKGVEDTVDNNKSSDDTDDDDDDSETDDETWHPNICNMEQNARSDTATCRSTRMDRPFLRVHAGSSQDAEVAVSKRIADVTSHECEDTTKKRTYTQWSDDDTKLVHQEFHAYINANGTGCTGSLPSKSSIERFLSQNPSILAHVTDLRRRTQLTRSKIFNERKLLRERLERRLQQLKH